MSQKIICFKCGKTIEEGGLFYIIEMKITSGFDGIIKESPDPDTLQALLDKLETEHAISAEEAVYKELVINLCKLCKDELVGFISGSELIHSTSNTDLTH